MSKERSRSCFSLLSQFQNTFLGICWREVGIGGERRAKAWARVGEAKSQFKGVVMGQTKGPLKYSRLRRSSRFRISTLLLLMAVICTVFAAYRRGYFAGRREQSWGPIYMVGDNGERNANCIGDTDALG